MARYPRIKLAIKRCVAQLVAERLLAPELASSVVAREYKIACKEIAEGRTTERLVLEAYQIKEGNK